MRRPSTNKPLKGSRIMSSFSPKQKLEHHDDHNDRSPNQYFPSDPPSDQKSLEDKSEKSHEIEIQTKKSNCCKSFLKLLISFFHTILKYCVRSFHSNKAETEKNLKKLQSFGKRTLKTEAKRFIRLVNMLMVLLKAIRKLKWRSSFKSIDFATARQIRIINDQAYVVEEESKKEKFNFIRNKFIRLQILALKKHFRRFIFTLKSMKAALKSAISYIPVIRPDKKIKIIWDLIIIFIISLFFFVIPMQLCFNMFYDDELEHLLESYHLNHSLNFFLVFLPELFLIIDTLLKFVTGFYENGVVVEDRSLIIHHYLKKGLIFDVISYVPVITQSIFKTLFPSLSFILKIFQLLMFFKIKRVKTAIANYEEIIASGGKHDYLLSACKLIYTVIFITHLNACVWHLTAYFYPWEGDTWLVVSGLKDSFWGVRYLYSFSWAISMMATIGAPNSMSVSNNLECAVSILISIVSVFFFGYCINSMKQILDIMSKEENDYKETVRIINGYMKSHSVNFELQSRVRNYLEYTLTNESKSEEEENLILNKLNKTLKKELLMESLGKHLKDIPFFKNNFSQSSIQNIVFSLRKVQLNPEEFVIIENVLDDQSIYFATEGHLEEVRHVQSTGNTQSMRKIKTGEIFGWLSFMTGQMRMSSIQSKDFSTVYEIKKSDFLRIIQANSTDYERFCVMRDQIKIYNNYECFDAKCSSCSTMTHFAFDCPKVHYMPDRDFLIRKMNFSIPQNRQTFKRHRVNKFNSLRKLALVQTKALKRSPEESESSLPGEETPINESCGLESFGEQREFPREEESPRLKKSKPVNFNQASEIEHVLPLKNYLSKYSIQENEHKDRLEAEKGPNIAFLHANSMNVDRRFSIKQKSAEFQNEISADLFDVTFDIGRNFEKYFPHNNPNNVLEAIKELRRKRQSLKKKIASPKKLQKLAGLSHFRKRNKGAIELNPVESNEFQENLEINHMIDFQKE